MAYLSEYLAPFAASDEGLLLIGSMLVMLIVIFFMYKTYRASLNVEARLAEFSSLSGNAFANRMQLIEVNADEYKLNKKALGPLGRIIDAYAVLATDAEGRITFANGRFLRLGGYVLQDLIGRPRSVLHGEAAPDPHVGDLQAVLDDGRVWHGELCFRSQQGRPFWIDAFVFPLSYLTDSDEGYMFFGTDITSLKVHNSRLQREVRQKEETISKVETMLLHSEKMASLGTISAGIAHEINNPIAFITANLTRFETYVKVFADTVVAVRERVPRDQFEKLVERFTQVRLQELEFMISDYPELLQETSEGIERVKKIIADLKSFSHDQSAATETVDVHKCIETSLNLAAHEIRHKVNVVRRFDESLGPVTGSESQLSQVFVNLIVNAAQAIEGRGEVVITTLMRDGQCTITIADDGVGMDADTVRNIFEPFYTTKPVGKGTGLGLSITHDIIKRHGGAISVQSEPGAGTIFTITLPLASGRNSHAA